MLYNNERKEWEHSGGSQGISRVHVYHHPINNTYRIVGRKVQDHAVCFELAYGTVIVFFVTNYYLLECEFCLEVIFGFIHQEFLCFKNADNNFCDVFGLVRVWMGCPVQGRI